MTMYIAEGSDWFWWYGADQNSGADDSFDRQFRSYLAQVFTIIGLPVPAFIHVPVIPQTPQQPARQPLDLLEVAVDGVVGEGEWDNAGLYPHSGPVINMYYGFDQETLYLRYDGPPDVFADGNTLGLYLNLPEPGQTNAYSRYGEGETSFGFGAKRLIEVTFEDGEPVVANYAADGVGGWEIYGEVVPATAALGGDEAIGVLEVAVPFAGFSSGLGSGDRINARLVASEAETDFQLLPAEGPALFVVPDLPIPNVFLTVEDPTGDDHGPGAYTYPTDQVFTPGSFDMTSFSAGYDDEEVYFRVQFDGPVENVWGSPNGLSIQTVDIYIDVDGPENGQRMLLPGRNAALTPDHAWDYAIWAEGWTPGVYLPGDDGPVQVTAAGLKIVANPGQNRVTISVPRSQS